jgi:hypothetical protein
MSNDATGKTPTPSPAGAATRSDNLLPAENGSEDGRFDVAEEVSLDQQSDAARQIGNAPDGQAGDAIARALQDRPVEGKPDSK